MMPTFGSGELFNLPTDLFVAETVSSKRYRTFYLLRSGFKSKNIDFRRL